MALLTTQVLAEAGITPTLVAATVGGDTITNPSDERTFLMVKNGSASTMTVTITAQSVSKAVQGYGSLTKANAVISVLAGAEMLIGPFPANAYNNASGLVSVTYSLATTVTVAALRCAPVSI